MSSKLGWLTAVVVVGFVLWLMLLLRAHLVHPVPGRAPARHAGWRPRALRVHVRALVRTRRAWREGRRISASKTTRARPRVSHSSPFRRAGRTWAAGARASACGWPLRESWCWSADDLSPPCTTALARQLRQKTSKENNWCIIKTCNWRPPVRRVVRVLVYGALVGVSLLAAHDVLGLELHEQLVAFVAQARTLPHAAHQTCCCCCGCGSRRRLELTLLNGESE